MLTHVSRWAAGMAVVLVVAVGTAIAIAAIGHRDHVGPPLRAKRVSSSAACPTFTTLAQPIPQTDFSCLHWMKGSASGTDMGNVITSSAMAITRVSHSAELLSGVGRTGAIETTWKEYSTLSSTGRSQSSPTVDPPGMLVWVACASATARPTNAAPGTTSTYSWLCAAYDASTGIKLSETMGQTFWPSWFTKLTPLAPSTP